MSDWIPVPEFENVLILMADLADEPEALAASPAMALCTELMDWQGGTLYMFHNPPEAGEILEDVDADLAARFALAAQMSDMLSEACRDALRRVFSRAVVQRVLLIRSSSGTITLDKIDALFKELETSDLIWAGEWPGQFALGMKAYHPEIFSDLNAADTDLRKCLLADAQRLGLKFSEVPIT